MAIVLSPHPRLTDAGPLCSAECPHATLARCGCCVVCKGEGGYEQTKIDSECRPYLLALYRERREQTCGTCEHWLPAGAGYGYCEWGGHWRAGDSCSKWEKKPTPGATDDK